MKEHSLRYPGAHPFETGQKDIFFGRKKTAKELYRLIKLENLVVLHSKSGLGKSSLLNASIIPKVLEDERYHPIRIRFNAWVEGRNNKTPLKTTSERIKGKDGSASTFLDKLIENEDSLWHDVKELQIQSNTEKGLLLILDQFEELFTYPQKDIDVFAKQLTEVLAPVLPQRYWDRLEETEDGELSDEELMILQEPIRLKIVAAIRSDRMSQLDRLNNFLPSILKNCFELLALDTKQAREAILLPAKATGDFDSAPFEYDPVALDNILHFLTQGKMQGIETTQLQIVCNAMERKAIAYHLDKIRPEDTDDLDKLIEKYYDEKIALLASKEQRDAARKLIEDQLIFEKEQRRLSMYEGQIISEGVTLESLNILVDNHLLRAEPSPQGGFIYELSHDTLVAPVLKAKEKRIAVLERTRMMEEQMKRESELEEINQKALEERQKAEEQAEKQMLLREKAEKSAVIAKNRTGLAMGALIISLLLAGFSGFSWKNAKSSAAFAEIQKEAAENAKEEVVRSARSGQNANLTLKTVHVNPTLALRIAEYNLEKHPKDFSADLAFSTVFNNPENTFYHKDFVGHRDTVSAVAFSPDGQNILTGSYDKTAILWDLQEKKLASFGHKGAVLAIAFSPNGKNILTGSTDSTAILWDLNGKELQSFVGHTGEVTSVAFSPDGRRTLTGSCDSTAILWNLKEGKLHTFKHTDRVLAVTFSPDGKRILTGSRDSTAILWNLKGKKIDSLAHKGEVLAVAFSPDGQSILTGNKEDIINLIGNIRNTATLWNLNGDSLQSFEYTGEVYTIGFSPDGQSILTGSSDKTARLWNLKGEELKSFVGHESSLSAIAFSPDGQSILTGSSDKTAKLWNLKGRENKSFGGHKDAILAVAFSPDGQRILTGSKDKTAKLWNLKGEELKSFKRHNDAVRTVAFSPDGRRILTGSWDNTAKLWNLKGRELQRFVGHKDRVYSVAFSPDGNSILTGSYDNTAKLWNLKEGKLHTFKHTDRVLAVTFSPDGQRILTGGWNGKAKLWDLNGDSLQSFEGHKSSIYSVAFSPDMNSILTGSYDNTAKLWDLNGDSLQSFEGHKNFVWSAAFSLDGQHILTGSSDNTAKLWNLNGGELQSFVGHTSTVFAAAFSPDGQNILTGSEDKTAKLWLNSEAFINHNVRKFTVQELLTAGVQLEREDLEKVGTEMILNQIRDFTPQLPETNENEIAAKEKASKRDIYKITKLTSLRAAPTSSSKVLKRLDVKTSVEVLEKQEKYWWKVKYNGREGYVKALLLEQT